MLHYIQKDIQKLLTPVGYFSVSHPKNTVLFSVVPNPIDTPCEVYDSKGTVVGHIHPSTNYQILIDPRQLDVEKEYVIQYSAGSWEHCDRGEHTTCGYTVINGWVVGIGAYDPNDERKIDQAWAYSEQQGFLKKGFIQHPPAYDETSFAKYTVQPLPDWRGFTFKLFDKEFDYVRFEVAWLHMDTYPVDEYAGALGLWLS